jgi:hypothetical protein
MQRPQPQTQQPSTKHCSSQTWYALESLTGLAITISGHKSGSIFDRYNLVPSAIFGCDAAEANRKPAPKKLRATEFWHSKEGQLDSDWP